MNRDSRAKKVRFVDDALRRAFLDLKNGRFEERQLAGNLEKAFSVLRADPFDGIRLEKKLWPKEYVRLGINNLRKYNLPLGWRLIYTLVGTDIEIVSVILEWFNHKEYNKRFGYKVG